MIPLMDRWIRWTTKTSTSLWHRASPATTLVRTRRARIQVGSGFSDPMVIVPPSSFAGATVYRRTACGFIVPPHERIAEWTGMPPLPRCIWCLHRWIVDTAPPTGAPPAQSGGGPSRIVIRARGKKPPTQHA